MKTLAAFCLGYVMFVTPSLAWQERETPSRLQMAAECKTAEDSVRVGKRLYTLLRTDDAEQLRKNISLIETVVVGLGCTPANEMAMRIWTAPGSMQNFFAGFGFSGAVVFRIRVVQLPFKHAIALDVDVGQLFKYLDEVRKRKSWRDA